MHRIISEFCRLILSICLALAPSFVLIFLFYFLFKSFLTDYIPYIDDEVLFLSAGKAFAALGFKSGYAGCDERLSSLSALSFGPIGTVFPVFFGSFVKLFPNILYVGPLFNLSELLLCTILFLSISRPKNEDLICLIIFVVLYMPLHIAIALTFQDAVMYGFTLVVASFYVGIIRCDRQSKPLRLFSLFFIALFSLIRVYNLFFMLMLLFGNCWKATAKKKSIALVAFIALLICLSQFSWSVAAYTPYMEETVNKNLYDLATLNITAVYSHVLSNFKSIFLIENPFEKMFCLLVVLQIFVIIPLFVLEDKAKHKNINILKLASFQFFLLLVVFLAQFTFGYEFDRFRLLRHFGPIAFMAFVVMLLTGSTRLKCLIIFLQIVLLVPGIDFYRSFIGNHFSIIEKERLAAAEISLPKLFVLSQPEDRWCNTVFRTAFNFPIETLALPAGFGFFLLTKESRLPKDIHSRFVISASKILSEEISSNPQFVFQGSSEIGDVYLNLKSPCNAAIPPGAN